MLWRQKQLEYTWLRTLMGRYEDFWAVTESALRFALRRLDIAASEAEIARLMEAYLSLATFPEVTRAFAALAGTPLGILSNGSPRMLMARSEERRVGKERGTPGGLSAVKDNGSRYRPARTAKVQRQPRR